MFPKFITSHSQSKKVRPLGVALETQHYRANHGKRNRVICTDTNLSSSILSTIPSQKEVLKAAESSVGDTKFEHIT
jgi:hypothetical protein